MKEKKGTKGKKGRKGKKGKNIKKEKKEMRTQEEKTVHSSYVAVVCSIKKVVATITTAVNLGCKKGRKLKEEELSAMEICLAPQGNITQEIAF